MATGGKDEGCVGVDGTECTADPCEDADATKKYGSNPPFSLSRRFLRSRSQIMQPKMIAAPETATTAPIAPAIGADILDLPYSLKPNR